VIRTSIHTEGFDKVYRTLQHHREQMNERNLTDVALVGARTAESLIKFEMSEPKTGEWYDRSWLRVPSSAPGEMPAIQSAELVNNMKSEPMSPRPGVGRAKLEAKGKHAVWMEFGWHDRGGYRHERPFMRTGIDKYRKEILVAMNTAMKEVKRK
jgi:hypothetical protein